MLPGKGAADDVGGQGKKRSKFKVVCVRVCVNGKPVDGVTRVSSYPIHKVLWRPSCNKMYDVVNVTEI